MDEIEQIRYNIKHSISEIRTKIMSTMPVRGVNHESHGRDIIEIDLILDQLDPLRLESIIPDLKRIVKEYHDNRDKEVEYYRRNNITHDYLDME